MKTREERKKLSGWEGAVLPCDLSLTPTSWPCPWRLIPGAFVSGSF